MAFRPATVYKSRDKPKALPCFDNKQNVTVRESFFAVQDQQIQFSFCPFASVAVRRNSMMSETLQSRSVQRTSIVCVETFFPCLIA